MPRDAGDAGSASARDDVLAANARFAATFRAAGLPAPPARRVAVLTCMDARIDPAFALGLAPGDAHVLRNAGAVVTDDVVRSLAVSHHVLGTRAALVVGHEDCGMAKLSNDELRERIGPTAADVDFRPFRDVDESVRESVRCIGTSPLLRGFEVWGFVYDVRTGRLRELD